jgi:hypothetical protein
MSGVALIPFLKDKKDKYILKSERKTYNESSA